MAEVNWRRVFFLTALFYFIYTWPTEGLGPVSISARPRVILLGGEVSITIRVPRSPENRLLVFCYWRDGDYAYKSLSEVPMDGDNEKPQMVMSVRPDEKGTWVFGVTLVRVHNLQAQDYYAKTTVEVQ